MEDEELVQSYIDWTEQSLTELSSHHQALSVNPSDTKLQHAIYSIAHNIKGMGSSFGFPLMTDAGASLCRYIKTLPPRPANTQVIEAHMKCFEAILTHRIRGTCHGKGEQLITRLRTLVDRSLAA
ncbi:MAG: Hpt domain-containing protein [Pseudomonadota bacterium]